MKKTMIIMTLLCLSAFQTAYAGLMVSVSAEAHFFGGIVGKETIEIDNDAKNRTINTSYESDNGAVYNQVWAGGSSGRGDGLGDQFYGGFGSGGEFTIDDIIISYAGSNILESQIVSGSVHSTHYVNVTEGGIYSSSFNLNLRVGTSRYSNKNSGESLLDNLFTWNVETSFILNEVFSLNLTSNLGVGASAYSASGYYKSVLGGSPVFILPDGFSANSADGTIVNNYYRGYNPITSVNQVPEPSTLFLLLIAVVIFITQLKQANKEQMNMVGVRK